MPDPLESLTRLLQFAGAPDPAGWAESEVAEDIPQLARYLFLRQAWRGVVAGDDLPWIDRHIAMAREDPAAPGAGLGPALERTLSHGCSKEDLVQIARTAQWELLNRLCYLLSDPSIEEPALQHVAWALVEVDPSGHRGREIRGLHESVLETDPTGREMRPLASKNP